MERKREAFEEDGIRVAALSYDSVEILKHFRDRRDIGFPMLSDPDSVVIRKFGVLNDSIAETHQFFGIPHPGQYLVDENGVVRAKFFEQSFRDRFTTGLIMVRQLGADLGAPRTEIETDHLLVSAWASDEVVVGGNRVALVLDIDLIDKMHVYAPEVEGYIPIKWELEEVTGLTTYAPTYPQSQMLHLPAIEETVPVYEGSIRLVADIKIGQKKEIEHLLNDFGELIVRGNLRYQACDDTICYIPQDIPLEWTFQLDDIDRTRVPETLRRNPPRP